MKFFSFLLPTGLFTLNWLLAHEETERKRLIGLSETGLEKLEIRVLQL